jgi:phage gp46-like protein
MPITTTGRDVALRRNPATGRFDLLRAADGNPTLTDYEEHAVLSQLLEWRASAGQPGWVADTTGRHGSLLYLVRSDLRATPSQVEAYALDALSTLVDLGRIRGEPDLRVKATKTAPGRFDLSVTWTTTAGRQGAARLALG